ncbi:MAG: hypothetical protein HUK40_13720 [Desulfobacter sp.]|nr:hypothetical protein [Desulfobacter sp.]
MITTRPPSDSYIFYDALVKLGTPNQNQTEKRSFGLLAIKLLASNYGN